MNPSTELERYYENEGAEEHRLAEGSLQRIEFKTATRYLARHLPRSGKILDSCAGTGIYSRWLSAAGYRVTAGDIVQCNIDYINAHPQGATPIERVALMDACDLSGCGDESFDAVLCMGALYHLASNAKREQALDEALRVLKPGGVLAVTYLNRHAVVMNNLTPDLTNIDDVMQFIETGVEGIFYASTPAETVALLETRHTKKLCHVALDGMAYYLVHTAHLLNEAALDRWLRLHFATCEEESTLGCSYHCLYLAQKAGTLADTL